MVVIDSKINVNRLERMAVNWALFPDALYCSLRSVLTSDKYAGQSFGARFRAISDGRIQRYHKLLTIKKQNNGHIPERVQELCKKSPCGYTRLLMTYLRT
jgi:hypothetical protein